LRVVSQQRQQRTNTGITGAAGAIRPPLEGDSIMTTRNNRFSRTVIGIFALVALTGAKGQGCGGGDDETGTTDPPPVACPEGSHLELVCDHGCADGWYGDDDIGYGSGSTGSGGPNMGSSGSGYDPGAPPIEPTGECQEICVPDDVCPEGSYEQIVCGGYSEPNQGGLCLDPNGCDPQLEPPPVEECYSVCMPYEPCGSGGEGYVVCDDWGCWEECGWNECPPGSEPFVECDEYGCWETCFGDDDVPPDPEPVPEPGQP
jgi:hypothetical protein